MEGDSGEGLVTIAVVGGRLRSGLRGGDRGHFQELAALLKLLLPVMIAQEPIVADTVKAGRQNVQQEAADELLGREGRGLVSIAVAVVLPLEGDVSVLDVEQAVVGDGDAVSVPSDVIENLLGTCEGRFRVDHPFLLPQRVEIPVEGLPLAQGLEGGEELELAALEGLTEQFQEAPTEEAREHPHGQEEPGPAGDPALTVGGESTARHHAMQVRVVHQVLPPGMPPVSP